jgi:hypothetical protein
LSAESEYKCFFLVFDETNRGKDGKLFFFPGKNEKIKGSTKTCFKRAPGEVEAEQASSAR